MHTMRNVGEVVFFIFLWLVAALGLINCTPEQRAKAASITWDIVKGVIQCAPAFINAGKSIADAIEHRASLDEAIGAKDEARACALAELRQRQVLNQSRIAEATNDTMVPVTPYAVTLTARQANMAAGISTLTVMMKGQ